MFFNYDERFWPYLDKSSSEIKTMLQSARAAPKGNLYKDFWSQIGIVDKLMYDLDDQTKKYTYEDFLNGTLSLRLTTYELMFIAQIGASDVSTTLPISGTNWYLNDKDNVMDYIIPSFAGYFITVGTKYASITNNAKRRDKINDILFVAKKWNTDYDTDAEFSASEVKKQMTPGSTYLN